MNNLIKQVRNTTFLGVIIDEGPDTPDAIRQRDAIFRFSLTDNLILS
jgi:hypothetical protein